MISHRVLQINQTKHKLLSQFIKAQSEFDKLNLNFHLGLAIRL